MTELEEVVLGRGDYVAGGARSLPFLDQDGARRRRPLVFGEVFGDVSLRDPLTDEMFSGRASDPLGWAVMWSQVGADGICVRTDGMDHDAIVPLIRMISDSTWLPIAVDGSSDDVREVAESINDTRLVLLAGEGCGDHPLASSEGGDMLLLKAGFPDPETYRRALSFRKDCLEGKERGIPILIDVTEVWEYGFADARSASMYEAEAALAAMLSGADAIIVRGPGAADMARVYGEELADL